MINFHSKTYTITHNVDETFVGLLQYKQKQVLFMVQVSHQFNVTHMEYPCVTCVKRITKCNGMQRHTMTHTDTHVWFDECTYVRICLIHLILLVPLHICSSDLLGTQNEIPYHTNSSNLFALHDRHTDKVYLKKRFLSVKFLFIQMKILLTPALYFILRCLWRKQGCKLRYHNNSYFCCE